MSVNCVNCGAAIEHSTIKCPFCGTSYFDFTHIDFNTDKPIAVKFKLPGDYIFSCLARPRLDELSVKDETVCAVDCWGSPIITLNSHKSAEASVYFDLIAQDGNRVLYTIQPPQE